MNIHMSKAAYTLDWHRLQHDTPSLGQHWRNSCPRFHSVAQLGSRSSLASRGQRASEVVVAHHRRHQGENPASLDALYELINLLHRLGQTPRLVVQQRRKQPMERRKEVAQLG